MVVLLAIIAAACGDSETSPAAPISVPTPDQRIDQILEEIETLADRVVQLEEQIATVSAPTSTSEITEKPTPTPEATLEPTATHESMMEEPATQEVAIIENFAATRFFPRWMVVLKDIPVTLYLTRLHREHVNEFTIAPFYSSPQVILPGEIGVMKFVPDQVGEFKIRNVGHDFEAVLVVVETMEEAKKRIAERGIQMYALIHSIDDFRIYPDNLVVQNDIPITIHNISLIAEHSVSIEPFYLPEGNNIRPREITRIEFTSDETGEFTVRHELHGFTGTLVVEQE